MFPHRLRPFLRLVTAVLLTAATPALAADVTNVSFTVTIAGMKGASPDISVEIRVVGTGLNNGKITLPSAPGIPIDLQKDGDDLVRAASVDDEAALAQFYPPGNYQLAINNNNLTATIAYDPRPAVPSPNIQFPGDGQVVAPGVLEVPFTACAVCVLSSDSTVGVLEDDMEMELANDALASTDTLWTPSDGMMGDFLLPESSAFLAHITHTAVREKPVIANGDDDNVFAFESWFVRSDAVAFETGFAPPEGDFCIEANAAAPDVSCAQLSDPTLSIIDPTGVLMTTTVNGLDVEYTLDVDPKGKITGTASADLDDDTTFETDGEVKGKLSGKEGEVKQSVKVSLRNDALSAKLKIATKEVLSIAMDAVTGTQKASGKIGDVKIKEETSTDESPLPVPPQSWRLDFTLDGTDAVIDPELSLEGGRVFPLEGSNKFDLVRDLTSLKLQSTEKGIKITLKKSAVDDDAIDPVTGGDLSYAILGQKGKLTLP